jgi:teichuronic acid biosynthesis glycosyltransferase TuaC
MTLVTAWAELKQVRGDARLYVIGEGSERAAAEQRAGRLGLASDILFLGSRTHGEIAEWLGSAHLLCLPSLREGCPNVVLEALSSGRPVVASAVGGVPTLVDATSGALVRPADPSGLARAIDDVLGREWDAAALRAKVATRSWGEAASAYLDVYRAAARPAMPNMSNVEQRA